MSKQETPLNGHASRPQMEFLEAIAQAVEPHPIAPNPVDVLGQRRSLLESIQALQPDDENNLQQLIRVIRAAFPMDPPHYLQALFGPLRTWLPPYHPASELNVLDTWRPIRSLKYLTAVTVPAVSRAPGPLMRTLLPRPVQHLFWRESRYFQQPDPFQSTTSFLNERWFFINGVATTLDVAKMNTELLSQMFYQPITGIYNSTNSLLVDLIECALDKRFKLVPDLNDQTTMTRPTYAAAQAIFTALRDPQIERVVVIGHSQGTLIAANVVRAIARALCIAESLADDAVATERGQGIESTVMANQASEPLERLACQCLFPKAVEEWRPDQLQAHLLRILRKLELYLFSNCADRLTYAMKVTTQSGQEIGLPYIENFANEHDLVARLGILSPLRKREPERVSLDGPLYLSTDRWGHFLNAHYLEAMHHHLLHPELVTNPYQRVDPNQPLIPRLYSYFGGNRPG